MTVILGEGQGRNFRIGMDEVTVKGMSSAGGVGFAVVDYRAAPGVPGPPLHVHEDIDEAWYLLEGELDVHVGEDRRRLTLGDFALVPQGVQHGFANPGPAWARWVGVLTPGSALGMLEALGQIVPPDGPPDPRAVMDLLARYRTVVVGPPLH